MKEELIFLTEPLTPEKTEEIRAMILRCRNKSLQKLMILYMTLVRDNPKIDWFLEFHKATQAKMPIAIEATQALLMYIDTDHVQEVLSCSKRTAIDYLACLRLVCGSDGGLWD